MALGLRSPSRKSGSRKANPPKRGVTKKRAKTTVAKTAGAKKTALPSSRAKKSVIRKKQPRPAAKQKQPAGRPSTMVENALAAFAHEVRTPLTGILAISDLLATSDLGERERRWVDTIKASADHLAALASLFVDAARSSKAGLDLRRDFFDCARWRAPRPIPWRDARPPKD